MTSKTRERPRKIHKDNVRRRRNDEYSMNHSLNLTWQQREGAETLKPVIVHMNAPVLLQTCTKRSRYNLDRQRQPINRVILLCGSSVNPSSLSS